MDIFEQIEMVDKNMIPDVMAAVLERYNGLFPDWDISTVAIEKKGDRKAQINAYIRVWETLLETEEIDMPRPPGNDHRKALRLVK